MTMAGTPGRLISPGIHPEIQWIMQVVGEEDELAGHVEVSVDLELDIRSHLGSQGETGGLVVLPGDEIFPVNVFLVGILCDIFVLLLP